MTHDAARNPLFRPLAVFLIALSLSIGWGIRGNFGHESGAMIAGVLSALAVALLSGREDWRRRCLYFALFGGLGWGFGGSISYMYPLSFTESGQAMSTYYGYFAVFFEGGLWCGMGAAGTAFAATMPSMRLRAFLTPLCFVLTALALRHGFEGPLEASLSPPGTGTGDERWHRHESPLYWFDSDWLPAVTALLGVWAFEWYDRIGRPRRGAIDHPTAIIGVASLGAAGGWLTQKLLRLAGGEETIRRLLVVKLGDLNYVNPETGNRFDPDQLLTNWPQFFSDYPEHLGWVGGLFFTVAVYFAWTGQFRKDAGLLHAMSWGWLLTFIALPVLGSTFLMEYGGLRMMPPRSDDWAGVLGVFVASLLWCRRHGLKPVAHVMSCGFVLGGIAFATVPMLRCLARYPGHPWRQLGDASELMQHYQSANWHSILEQMHGFGLGIAIAISMGMLWRRTSRDSSAPLRPDWTDAFSVWFVVFGIGYLNLHKIVGTWIAKGAIPESLKAPLLGFIEATPLAWFRLVWWSAAAVFAVLLAIHLRRKLEIVPIAWNGKGQLTYVLFLWLLVIGNLQRAIPGFSQGRMVTEWVLFMNGCLATLLVVALPRPSREYELPAQQTRWRNLAVTWVAGLGIASVLAWSYGSLTLSLYQTHLEGPALRNHRRFGPDAKWRISPILKHGDHP